MGPHLIVCVLGDRFGRRPPDELVSLLERRSNRRHSCAILGKNVLLKPDMSLQVREDQFAPDLFVVQFHFTPPIGATAVQPRSVKRLSSTALTAAKSTSVHCSE